MALVAEPISTPIRKIEILYCINFGTFNMKANIAMIASDLGDSSRNGLYTQTTMFIRHIQDKTIQPGGGGGDEEVEVNTSHWN